MRTQRRLTQAALAQAMGVTEGTIRRYELGLTDIRYLRLCALIDALDINANDLIATQARNGGRLSTFAAKQAREIERLGPKDRRDVARYIRFRRRRQPWS